MKIIQYTSTGAKLERNRLAYFLLIVISFTLAIFSRWFREYLPEFIAAYAGDYFSGFMAFGLIGALFPRLTTLQLGLASLIFAWAIEFQQLYRAQWLVDIRAKPLGSLILGNTFAWSDIYCLAAGVITITFIEFLYIRRLKS